MTNQEAAEMIRNDMKIHHDYLSGQYRKALNMAIDALLKDRDAVEPITDIARNRRCPKCLTILKGKFCHVCGQEVKLHDSD